MNLTEAPRLAASFDAVTGLPGRAAIEATLREQLACEDPAFALMFIDLDGFREVNESYGHPAGDAVLREFARRFVAAIGTLGMLGRWNADQFLLVLRPGCGDIEVRGAAQSVLAALREPLRVEDHELLLSASLGAVRVPLHGRDAHTLLQRVEAAMQAAKQRGPNALVIHAGDAPEFDARRRMMMASQLRLDAQRNGFRFAAQPKVDACGRPTGVELLMRWHTEAFGAVSPVEFIPLAEKLGLIELMGRHAMHAAALLAAQMQSAGAALPVAVNLSPRQLRQAGLDRQLMHACERHGIAPALLELELTESALVHGIGSTVQVLRHLSDLGFSLALDDFGTGYSSLSYLRHLPFDKVKIDRSFVTGVDTDPRAALLLQNMVRLCEGLDLRTVAEGVETAAEFEALKRAQVHEFQGYHFMRPIDTADWLARWSARHAALVLP